MPKTVLTDAEEKMKKSIEVVKHELTSVRTGRASTSLLDTVRVDYYGTPTPIAQVANVSTPDARLIVVQPWERNMIGPIEKAIMKADLGLNPTNDGSLIRLPVPPLTEERRKDMSRLVHKYAEEGRNAVRMVRRDANERLKKLLKDHKISEDDERRALDEVQKITDQHVTMIDDLQKKKDGELLGK